ncbi:MAG: hypothetical protein CM1200mP30_03650 [Pseudomonadota bacterium]|nr:MAG: hypothetical protein CM1200mP30_03650 [Pseudomonadota bacterium]
MYAEGHKVRNAPKLPLNLLDALRNFQQNKILRGILGGGFRRFLLQTQDG